jgi:hypothetical protein
LLAGQQKPAGQLLNRVVLGNAFHNCYPPPTPPPR